jgi:hypothetical protein
VEKISVCKGICVNILAFIVGGIAAWFITHGIQVSHLTVLPVEAMQHMFAI